MHAVRLLAPPLAGPDYRKDIDVSPAGIRERWAAMAAMVASIILGLSVQQRPKPARGIRS